MKIKLTRLMHKINIDNINNQIINTIAIIINTLNTKKIENMSLLIITIYGNTYLKQYENAYYS